MRGRSSSWNGPRRGMVLAAVIGALAFGAVSCAAHVPESLPRTATTADRSDRDAPSSTDVGLGVTTSEGAGDQARADRQRGEGVATPAPSVPSGPASTDGGDPPTVATFVPGEPDPGQVADAADAGIEVVSAVRSESNDAPPYEIETAVPVLVHPDAEVADSVNAVLSDLLTAQVDLFRSDIEEYFGDSAAGVEPSTFTTEFAITFLSDDLLSLRFRSENKVGGSGTPTTQMATAVFDLTSGEQLDLEDIVGADGLEEVADLVKEEIVRLLYGGDADAFAPWASSIRPERVGTVSVSADGLQFGFDQFEIGPDALEAPVVEISFDDLAGLIDPDSVVAALA